MSTIDAVNALIEEVTDNLDSKLKCSMVSLDLSKAFDTIDHNILINKLSNIGIRGVCLKLMKIYLFNRKNKFFLIIVYHHYYLYKWELPGFCSGTPVVYNIYK